MTHGLLQAEGCSWRGCGEWRGIRVGGNGTTVIEYSIKYIFKIYKKMGKGPEQTLLQKGQTQYPYIYERMLSLTSHQRDAN